MHDATSLGAGKRPAVEKPLQTLVTERVLSLVSIISYQDLLKNKMNHKFLAPNFAAVLERDLFLSVGKKALSRKGPHFQGLGLIVSFLC